MEETKSERIGVRITPSTKKNIEKIGLMLGKTYSEVIRDLTLRIINNIGDIKDE